jgi:hypothetical protein
VERTILDRDDWTLLRVSTPDRPGGLAMFARCMAACGVDILSLEILGHEPDGQAIADVLVHNGDLDRALRALDEDVRLLGRRSHGELPDPGLAMAAACAALVREPTADSLLDAARILVGADVAAVYRCMGDGVEPAAMMTAGLDDLAGEARAAGRAVTAEPSAGSSVAVPIGDPPVLVIALARSLPFPFQAVEVERLRALGALAMRVLSPLAPGSAASDSP